MEIIEKEQEGVSVFKLTGRLDSKTSPEFEKKIFDAIEKGSKNMIVDFEDLDYFQCRITRYLKGHKGFKAFRGKIRPLFHEGLCKRGV